MYSPSYPIECKRKNIPLERCDIVLQSEKKMGSHGIEMTSRRLTKKEMASTPEPPNEEHSAGGRNKLWLFLADLTEA